MSSTSLTFHQLRPIRVVEVCHKERRFQICFKIFEDIVVTGSSWFDKQNHTVHHPFCQRIGVFFCSRKYNRAGLNMISIVEM